MGKGPSTNVQGWSTQPHRQAQKPIAYNGRRAALPSSAACATTCASPSRRRKATYRRRRNGKVSRQGGWTRQTAQTDGGTPLASLLPAQPHTATPVGGLRTLQGSSEQTGSEDESSEEENSTETLRLTAELPHESLPVPSSGNSRALAAQLVGYRD